MKQIEDICARLEAKTHESDGIHGIFEVPRNPDGPEGATLIRSLGQRVGELETLCRANNDLARMNGHHRDEWRDKAVGYMEALEPFANAAESIDETDKDGWNMWEHSASLDVTVADFRKARSTLAAGGTPA
jgi:hypothetical protein